MIAAAENPRLVGKIPVRNLWLLMLYASRLYRQIPSHRRYAIEQSPDDIPNLVAEILTRAVERRLRRNLSHDFRERHADLTRVRGRIDHVRTACHHLLHQGRIACLFNELTTDTQRNRFVKAALKELTKTVDSDGLAKRCRAAVAALERAGVWGDPPVHLYRRGIEVPAAASRTNSEDQQMLAAAQLAFRLDMPTEELGHSRLTAPDRDEVWARRLFEAAVGGFYDTILSPRGWAVRTGRSLRWLMEDPTPGAEAIIPSMKTDIELERPVVQGEGTSSRTIIDTKFANILTTGRYDHTSLHSGYIYQIYAYLRSQERDDDPPSVRSSGMLLHPSVGVDIDEAVTIQGHRIRFATVDLATDSRSIRNRLLSLVDAPGAR